VSADFKLTIPDGFTAECSLDFGVYVECGPSPSFAVNVTGTHWMQVRTKAPSGARSRFIYYQWSLDLPSGVSINDGQIYTNTPKVDLSLVWNPGGSTVVVSNDGGFRGVRPQKVKGTIPWTLTTSGAERLPKTVYIRYAGDPTTYTDDIILDQTAPTLSSASGEAATLLARKGRFAALVPKPAIKLKLSASDKTSGVGTVQVTADKTKAGVSAKFSTSVTLLKPSTTTKTFYVRVKDKAGNNSAWKTITVR
jgi:hypothetical protein